MSVAPLLHLGSAQTCGITGPKNWPSAFWGQELRANRIFVMNHLRNFGIAQDDWGWFHIEINQVCGSISTHSFAIPNYLGPIVKGHSRCSGSVQLLGCELCSMAPLRATASALLSYPATFKASEWWPIKQIGCCHVWQKRLCKVAAAINYDGTLLVQSQKRDLPQISLASGGRERKMSSSGETHKVLCFPVYGYLQKKRGNHRTCHRTAHFWRRPLKMGPKKNQRNHRLCPS